MRWPAPYTIFCAVVLIVFAWTKYAGVSIGDTGMDYTNRNSGSGGGFFYTGTSGGYHK